MIMYHLQPISSNKKTGPIATSTSDASTCPPSCGLFETCYAKTGPQALHWRKVTEGSRGNDWQDFIAKVKALPRRSMFRHNVSGDLQGLGESLDAHALGELMAATAARQLTAWTYTHKTRHADMIADMSRQHPNGLIVNLSTDNLAHADMVYRQRHGLPVVTMLPSHYEADRIKATHTPDGHLVVTCPATIREGVTCQSCGNGSPLCARRDRAFIVGFPAHGTRKKKANLIAMTEGE